MFTNLVLRLLGYKGTIDRILRVFATVGDQLTVVLEKTAVEINAKQAQIDALKAQQSELYGHTDRAARIKERLDKFLA